MRGQENSPCRPVVPATFGIPFQMQEGRGDMRVGQGLEQSVDQPQEGHNHHGVEHVGKVALEHCARFVLHSIMHHKSTSNTRI